MELKNIHGTVLFTSQTAQTTAELVAEAVKAKTDLTRADLSGANLTGADLTGAYLNGAYLGGAYLNGAYLTGADLSGADLRGVKHLHWQICPEIGQFYGFKKVKTLDDRHAVIVVRIDAESARMNGVGSRKCRAEYVYVVRLVSGPQVDLYKSPTHGDAHYKIGEYVVADTFVDDPRLECTGGIHFFMTLAEAEEWSG